VAMRSCPSGEAESLTDVGRADSLAELRLRTFKSQGAANATAGNRRGIRFWWRQGRANHQRPAPLLPRSAGEEEGEDAVARFKLPRRPRPQAHHLVDGGRAQPQRGGDGRGDARAVD
jgi:hypothetical protein